jgi:F-type H+-transporting ATPase subunit gamma
MAKGRQLKGRIRSVQNTRKITKTMELVAGEVTQAGAGPGGGGPAAARRPREVILFTAELAERHPALRRLAVGGRSPGRGGHPAHFNRGLAGGFNANLTKEARRRIEQLESEGRQGFLRHGKKGIGFFRHPAASRRERQISAMGGRPRRAIVQPLIASYAAGELASVDLIQAQFISALQTPPATVHILPVEAPASGAPARDYILAPSAEAILEELLPLYVRNALYRGLVETAAAEHGARRTAMKNATDNAGEILELLKRTYNRQRQAQITQEIAEIVGGAAALQG